MFKVTVSSKYQVSQVWSYHNRPGEDNSRLLGLKVEVIEIEKETWVIVHVYIEGISIETFEGGMVPAIPHLVFSEDAVDRSVNRLLGITSSLPDCQFYLKNWQSCFEKEMARVYELTIAEAIGLLDRTLKIQLPIPNYAIPSNGR